MTTVTGFILDSSGRAVHAKILIKSLSTPSSLGSGQIVTGTSRTIASAVSDGSFSIGLEAGDYSVNYQQSVETTPVTFQISVPSGSSTIPITDLITTNLTYTYSLPPNTVWSGQLPEDISLNIDGQVAIIGNSGNPTLSFRYAGTVYNLQTTASSFGNLTEATSSVLTITGGTAAVHGSGTSIQVKQASGSQSGFLSSTDWTTFNNKLSSLTTGNLTENTSAVLTITGGTGAVIGGGATIQVHQANTTTDGFLTHTDWNTFNGKQAALTIGNLTEATSSVLTIVGGTGSIIGSGLTVQVKQSNTSQAGYLSAADWNTFNGKENVLTFSAPLSRTSNTISIPAATGSVDGYLAHADWNTFNNKQAALGFTPVNKAGDTMTGNLTMTLGDSGYGQINISQSQIMGNGDGGLTINIVGDGHITSGVEGDLYLETNGASMKLGVNNDFSLSFGNGCVFTCGINAAKLSAVIPNGIAVSGYSVNGSDTTAALAISGNWFTTGIVTAFLINLIDTESDSASNFLDFQIGGGSKFSVLKNGEPVIPSGAIAGYVLTCDGSGRGSWQNPIGGGTVTSVGLSVPAFLSVAGSPVTTSGTLAVSLATQTANTIFAGPTTGSAAAPTFRAMVSADLPSTISGVTWNGAVIGEAYGGTHQSSYALGDILYASASNTLSKLAGNTAATRKFLLQVGTGTISAAPSWAAISSTDVDTALGYTPANVAGDTFTGNVVISGSHTLTVGGSSSLDNGALTTNGSGSITAGTWAGTAIADNKIASALTGKTYNALTLTAASIGFTIAGGTTSKTLTVSNTLALAGTDGSTLNVGTGGTLGSAAFTASSAYLAIGGGTLTGLLTITQGTANTSVITSTGYSLTGSDAHAMLNLAGTWNTTGVPTAIKLNITNTASDATSLLMDLQVGGTSKFNVDVTGTVNVGIWAGSPIAASHGGTGITSPSQGSLIIGTTGGWTSLTKNTTSTRYLSNTGTNNSPAWAQVDLTNGVTGTLPVGNGGTGVTTLSGFFNSISPVTTLGDLIYGSGASTSARLAGNTTSTQKFLAQTGTGSISAAPAWVAIDSTFITTALGFTPANKAGDTFTGAVVINSSISCDSGGITTDGSGNISIHGSFQCDVSSGSPISSDGSGNFSAPTLNAGNGWNGTFLTADTRTATVVNGIITDVS